jgi:hypothetical protein
MNLTMLEISVAVIMLIVSVAMLVWFNRYLAAASTDRMTDMMGRYGLDPGIGTYGDPRIEAIMKEVRQRCRKCQAEDVCERWLLGEVKGRNSFCPNEHIFRILARTAEHAN